MRRRAAADGGTRLGGAESKRRRRPRLPAPPSRVTLLAHAGEPAHDRLLHVEAILGLVEDHRLRAVEHGVRDLLAAMGGEAVHDERARAGERDDALVHLIGAESAAAGLRLGLLAHARPHVGVDDVGAAHAPAARSTTLWWRKVRAMTRSTHRSRFRAMSPADSRSPSRMSPGAK